MGGLPSLTSMVNPSTVGSLQRKSDCRMQRKMRPSSSAQGECFQFDLAFLAVCAGATGGRKGRRGKKGETEKTDRLDNMVTQYKQQLFGSATKPGSIKASMQRWFE